MKAEDIKIGEPIWFDDSVQMVDWAKVRTKSAFFLDTFTFPGYKTTDIRTYKDEKYLIVATRNVPVEWAVKFSELIDKGLLEKDNPFTVGDEVEPIDLSGDLQIYDIKKEKFVKCHTTSPNTYVNFKIKVVQGDYIQEQIHDHIWFKASDFKNKETMITKPYNDVKEVTYYMITTHPYFQRLSEKELARIIEFMDYNGFTKLDGEDGWEKAKILRESFQANRESSKQVSKKPFTVEGSTRLRKALAEELKEEAGFQVCAAISLGGMNYDKYLTPGADKVVGVTNDKATIHYTLPGDWDKSLQAFKDYFTPEFKEGDIVVVLEEDRSVNNPGDIGKIIYIGAMGLDMKVDCGNGNYGIWHNYNSVRPATKEEIEQYKASKEKITVAGYEMKIAGTLTSKGEAGKMAKFCDQYFTIQELESYKKLLQLQKYIYVNIRLGDTTLDLELIDKIISKLK